MPIPDIPEIAAAVASLSLTPPRDGGERIEVVPRKLSSMGPKLVEQQPVEIWRTSGGITTEALLERIAKELRHNQHFASTSVARVVLGMLCLSTKAETPSVSLLNDLMTRIVAGDCSRFLIASFPPHRESRSFEIGEFFFGPLNLERLEYRCRRVQCDYFDQYPGHFRHRFAIESKPSAVHVLDWPTISKSAGFVLTPTGMALGDRYFELLTIEAQRRFHIELMAAQEILAAAGAPVIDVSQWAWTGASFIGIFQNLGPSGWGYFCPLGTGLTVDFAHADVRFPAIAKELRDTFGFDGIADWQIHDSLRTYSRFVMRARIHWNNGRIDEAFLHYVIALDLLLGDKNASNERISKRAAIIASGGDKGGYESAVVRVRELYERRSRYVHNGIAIDQATVDAVVPIVREVLHCLLRLQNTPDGRAPEALVQWLKRLDFLAAAMEAGHPLDKGASVSAGISVETAGAQ